VSRDKGKGKAVEKSSGDLQEKMEKKKKDREKKKEKKRSSEKKKKARARSPSPSYILPNGMTMLEFIQFVIDHKIRMPDPKWDQFPPSKFEDYVTKDNPRLGIEIDRAMGGRFLAEFKKRIFPIESVKPFIRRTIIKYAMVVPYCAPWEYYADFILASSARNPPKPNMAMLRVNKSIGADAAMYLYAFNTFVFKSPDYFICFMIFMSVSNLLCMEFDIQITLCEPFPMILRKFEAHWLIKNLRILNGVMIGDLSDEWDVAYMEFLEFATTKTTNEEEYLFATDAEASQAMKAFGVVGHPKRIRPLDTLMKSKEVMMNLFEEEYWASFADAGVADVLDKGDTEIFEDEVGKEKENEKKGSSELEEVDDEDDGESESDEEDTEGEDEGDDTETETVRGRPTAPAPAPVHYYGPLGNLCEARLRYSIGSSLAGGSTVASSSTGRSRSSWETYESGSTQK
jgi:hypothetical protein